MISRAQLVGFFLYQTGSGRVLKEMSGSRRVQAGYKGCWSVEVFKYSVGYCRVPYLLSGISGYVGYFRVFRVDTIFLVAPKCRVYPKYQVIPDI